MEDNKETVEDVKVEETGNVGTQANQNKDEGKAVETFTQEQVNTIIKKEKEKITNKYKDINIDEYKSWKESQKTAEQKQAEKEAEYVEKDKKITLLENKLKLKDANVSKEYEEFVLFTVSNMDGEFEENLNNFLKDNPKYINGVEVQEQKATGTPVKTISSSETDGVLAILKAKHPEMNI